MTKSCLILHISLTTPASRNPSLELDKHGTETEKMCPRAFLLDVPLMFIRYFNVFCVTASLICDVRAIDGPDGGKRGRLVGAAAGSLLAAAAAHSSAHLPILPPTFVSMQSARQAARVVLRAAATNGAVATRGAAAAKQIAAAYSTLTRARCNGQQAQRRRRKLRRRQRCWRGDGGCAMWWRWIVIE